MGIEPTEALKGRHKSIVAPFQGFIRDRT